MGNNQINKVKYMIGKKVKVIIDRPLGTYHPKHKDIYYSLNYGYIEGIIANDGEEQDAYIVGIDSPLKEFEGEVIAIIHRLDDVEDKWVVAPVGKYFAKEEIEKLVSFQEKFFKTEIYMNKIKKKIAYPAIIRKDEKTNGYDVIVPDIFGGVTCGNDYSDAIEMAKDMIKLMINEAPGQCFPPKSLKETQNIFKNEKVILIEVEID